jgi:hypothetical protein
MPNMWCIPFPQACKTWDLVAQCWAPLSPGKCIFRLTLEWLAQFLSPLHQCNPCKYFFAFSLAASGASSTISQPPPSTVAITPVITSRGSSDRCSHPGCRKGRHKVCSRAMCKKDCIANSGCVCPGHNQGSQLSSHPIVGLSAGRTNANTTPVPDSYESSRQLEKRRATSLAPFAPGTDLHALLDIASPSLTFSNSHIDWPSGSVSLDKDLEIQTNLDDIDRFLNVLDDDEEREMRELELAMKLSLSPQFSRAASPERVVPRPVTGSVSPFSTVAQQPSHPLGPPSSALSATQPTRPRDARKPTITKQMSDVWFREYQNNTAERSKKTKQKRSALRNFILVYWDKVRELLLLSRIYSTNSNIIG